MTIITRDNGGTQNDNVLVDISKTLKNNFPKVLTVENSPALSKIDDLRVKPAAGAPAHNPVADKEKDKVHVVTMSDGEIGGIPSTVQNAFRVVGSVVPAAATQRTWVDLISKSLHIFHGTRKVILRVQSRFKYEEKSKACMRNMHNAFKDFLQSKEMDLAILSFKNPSARIINDSDLPQNELEWKQIANRRVKGVKTSMNYSPE